MTLSFGVNLLIIESVKKNVLESLLFEDIFSSLTIMQTPGEYSEFSIAFIAAFLGFFALTDVLISPVCM